MAKLGYTHNKTLATAQQTPKNGRSWQNKFLKLLPTLLLTPVADVVADAFVVAFAVVVADVGAKLFKPFAVHAANRFAVDVARDRVRFPHLVQFLHFIFD